MENEIMETVMRDMLQDLEELKQQKQHLIKLEGFLETHYQLSLQTEQKLSCFNSLPVTLTEAQITSLKDVVKQEFEMLQSELRKLITSNKNYYSIFPVSFRMEYFRMVVNTVMIWFVILIVLFFVMWLIVVQSN